MPVTGVTPQGFVAKSTQDLLTDIETQEKANIDPALDVSADSPIGEINGINASKLSELWELAQVAYDGLDPDKAEGAQLDAVCALTGTIRTPASFSAVLCTVNLDGGRTLPAGSVCNVTGHSDIRFQSAADLVNATGAPITYTGVKFIAQQPGPVVANAGTLTVITTPVTGWNTVTNPLDATLGTLVETDADLRLKRQAELAVDGGSTPDATRAALLQVKGVLQAFVFENTSMSVDANGLPSKSFECVIYDGAVPAATDADLAACVWKNKPSGIQPYGSIAATTADSTGTTRNAAFSRPVIKTLYQTLVITTDTTFPADGIAQVKAAIALKAGKTFNLGVSVIALAYEAAALTVQGVTDVTSYFQGFAPGPVSGANLAVAGRELAVADTTRMLVNGL